MQMNIAQDLDDVRHFLRAEECNRIVQDNGNQNGYTLIACVSQIIGKSHEDLIQNMCTFLERHKNQIFAVRKLLDSQSPDDLENAKNDKLLDTYIKNIISSIGDNEIYKKKLSTYIYVFATFLQLPLFIPCRNDYGKLKWEYYPPLFFYNAAPILNSRLRYITIMMTSSCTFFQIETRARDTKPPKASGLIGMYSDLLKDENVATIGVPYMLLKSFPEKWPVEKRKAIENIVTSDIIKCCYEQLKPLGLLEVEQVLKLATHMPDKKCFLNVIEQSKKAFCEFCKVLIKRNERKILEQFCESWDELVNEVDILKKFNALAKLKASVARRNVVVTEILKSCQIESFNVNERRKKVTTAVIAGSAVGIVGGAMAIAGLVLVPFTFGVSIALTAAGAAIGVGGSVTGGGFRVFEAVKQNKAVNGVNSMLKDIQDIELSVWQNLGHVEELFRTTISPDSTGSNLAEVGINLKGFMAIGSVMKSVHGAIGIILAASRIGATGATLAAHALGPISMVLDIAFLAEAAHNKATGDKTDAGKILLDIGNTIEAKCSIGNSLIMGNNYGQN